MDIIRAIRNTPIQRLASQSIAFISLLSLAFIAWGLLLLLTGSSSPIIVVISGSMKPGLSIGDLLLVKITKSQTYSVGDIIVFNTPNVSVPVIHRIIRSQMSHHGQTYYITKGDANDQDDRELYADADGKWLPPERIKGKAFLIIPYVGLFSLAMNQYPLLRGIFIGLVGVLFLVSRNGLD